MTVNDQRDRYEYRDKLNIGNQAAESDLLLHENFVAIQTSKFIGHGDHSIIVGRKGSGKSALRIHFENKVQARQPSSGSGHHTSFLINPSSEDLINTFSYVVESEGRLFSVEFTALLWELTAYLNLARICYAEERPLSLPVELAELPQEITDDLTKGARYGLGRALDLISDHFPDIRGRSRVLRSLRQYVRRVVLQGRTNYYIMIDSVDDVLHNTLDTTQRNDLFATFFEGLLSFFQKFSNFEQNAISRRVFIHLFIPTDIYDWSVSRNADKFRAYKQTVYWHTHELDSFITSRLYRNLPVGIQGRIAQLPADNIGPAIWNAFFPGYINSEAYTERGQVKLFETPTRSVLLSMTLRRPRDLQDIVRHVDDFTREKGLRFPNELAVLTALDRYSADLKQSVVSEYKFVFPQILEVLSQFSGNSPFFSKDLLLELIGRVVGRSGGAVYDAANILFNACIIGGVRTRRYSNNLSALFYYDFRDFSTVWNYETFAVHGAFWHALQIRSLRSGRMG